MSQRGQERNGDSPGKGLELCLVLCRQNAVDRRQRGLFTGKLSVEPAGVTGVLELGAKGWCDPLVEHVVPIDVAEKGVCLDFLCVRGASPESLGGVSRKELWRVRKSVSSVIHSCRHVSSPCAE